MATNTKGDSVQLKTPPPTEDVSSREEAAKGFGWSNRSAKDWSRLKFRELFKDQKFDTPAGVCTITDVEKCEGDAYGVRNVGSYTAEYDWTIRLRWKGFPKETQDLVIPGTIEIRNFRSNNTVNDLNIQLETDVRRPEADKLLAAFRSVVLPRLRGHLENYVYYLLDVLKLKGAGTGRPSHDHSANKPGKPHVWLKSSQPDVAEGDTDATSSQAPAHIDIFQEREGAGGMRVGRDFQAKIPPLLSLDDRHTPQENNDRALLVWSPPSTSQLTHDDIEKYLEISRDKYQYSGEQALGLLFWHRYDVDKSLQDLGNFTPHPEEWTVEDKVLFEQAFQFHGKAFDRIRQMLPDKSMSNLIRYYYKWKKFKNKTSVMDRQAKKFSQEDVVDDPASLLLGTGNNNNNKHSSSNVVGQNYKISLQRGANISDMEGDDAEASAALLCSNCGIPCTDLNVTENMCNTCFLYWKKTGVNRPLTGPLKRGERQTMSALRQRRCPPKGMFINHDDLNTLASSTPSSENVTLQGLEKAVLDEKCKVQIKKQQIEILKQSLPPDGMARFKRNKEKLEMASNSECQGSNGGRVTSRRSQEELLMLAARSLALADKSGG